MKMEEIEKSSLFEGCSIAVKKEDLPNGLLTESVVDNSVDGTVTINLLNSDHFFKWSSALQEKEFTLSDNGKNYLIVGDVAKEQ